MRKIRGRKNFCGCPFADGRYYCVLNDGVGGKRSEGNAAVASETSGEYQSNM